jgi:hypothetical protein
MSHLVSFHCTFLKEALKISDDNACFFPDHCEYQMRYKIFTHMLLSMHSNTLMYVTAIPRQFQLRRIREDADGGGTLRLAYTPTA